MPDPVAQQNSFHHLLTSYVNGGCLNRADRLMALLASRRPFERNANRVCSAHKAFREVAIPASGVQEEVSIEIYDGGNAHVQRMRHQLARDFRDELAGAYVHGSLATQEEIGYSDFDALVILKDRVFDDPRHLVEVAVKLNRARRIMIDADPLQHHGWFVLCEADLKRYCDAYFPSVLFTYSKSLLEKDGRVLRLNSRDSVQEMREGFDSLATSCLQMIRNRRNFTSAYLLKCALSQFMLMPALYVQVREGKGIYKKFSFDKARQDFSATEWDCMDLVSQLRSQWQVSFHPLTRRLLAGSATLRNTAIKRLSPPIPNNMLRLFTPDFLDQMANLIRRMQAAVALRQTRDAL